MRTAVAVGHHGGRIARVQEHVQVGTDAREARGVSDDLLSDPAGAKRMGMRAVFVLSGKYRERSVPDAIPASQRPDLLAETIDGLLTADSLEL